MKNLKYFWIASVVVVVMWLFNAFIYPLWVPSLSSRASNGDAFGAVNALFSGLAFAGLIYTMVMQRQELELQRIALKEQQDEMRASREEMVEQNQLQAKQLKVSHLDLTFRSTKLTFACIERKIAYHKLCAEVRGKSTQDLHIGEISRLSDELDRLEQDLSEIIEKSQDK